MPPVTHVYRRFPLLATGHLPAPPLAPPPSSLSLLAYICLKLLAIVAAHTQRRGTLLPRTAPLATYLRLLGLPDTTATWDALEQDGLIEFHTTATRRSVRLTPLGLLQVKYYAPPAVAPNKEAWLHRVLCYLYGIAPSPITTPSAGVTWDEVRTRYPAHWVVLEVICGHDEGNFFLPDRVVVCTAHPNYAEAHAYYQPFSLSPTHLLTHTSITTLVLQRPHPCYA